MITWENYEEYIMMHADGELQPAETQALMAFINKHQELKSELAAYEMVRLSPDMTEVYENKDALLKPSVKKIISLPQWGRYSIAACIAALLFFSFFKYSGKDDVVDEVVATNSTAPVLPALQNNIAPQQPVATVQSQAATVIEHSRKDVVAVQHKAAVAVVKEEKQTNEPEVQAPVAVVHTNIDVLPVAEMKEIPHNSPINTAVATDEPAYAMETVDNDDSKKRSLLDRLPIDNIKKKELGNIASAISDAYSNVRDDKRKISIKIEKKRLILSF